MPLVPSANTPVMPDVSMTGSVLSSYPAEGAPSLPPAEAAKQPAEVQQPVVAPQAAPAKPCVAGHWVSADVYDESRPKSA